MAVRINGESLQPATARINHAAVSERGSLQIALQVLPVFGRNFRPVQVEGDYFFRRKPHRQWRLRTINAWIDKRIKLEVDPQFLLRKFPHAYNFVAVNAGGYGFQSQGQPAFK